MPGRARTKVFYQDDEHIRVSAGQQGYMRVSGDSMYSVMVRGDNRVAMDIVEMSKAMARAGGADEKPDASAPGVSIRDTGRKETVAGFEGLVHEVTVDGRTLAR